MRDCGDRSYKKSPLQGGGLNGGSEHLRKPAKRPETITDQPIRGHGPGFAQGQIKGKLWRCVRASLETEVGAVEHVGPVFNTGPWESSTDWLKLEAVEVKAIVG